MRIKVKTNGTMDGMFYKSDAGGFAESRHMMFTHITPVTTTADGYEIYEFDILNYPEKEEAENWYGTISALRYDAMWSTGTTYTDYIVFTDKLGIFKLDLTLEKGANEAGLESGICVFDSVEWNGDAAKITVAPFAGYEFTSAEDILAFATVNGEKVHDAFIDEDCNAVITYVFKTEVNIGNTDGQTVKATVKFDTLVTDATVVVAVYGEGDRFIAAAIIDVSYADEIEVLVDKNLGAKSVKAFALDDLSSVNPVTANATATLE